MADPGAPYPPPRPIARTSVSHGMEEAQMLAMDQANMARILQAENARGSSQTRMDVQMGDSNQMQPHPQHLQHDQTAFYPAPQGMSFEAQHMEYNNFATHQPQHQHRPSANGMQQMPDFEVTKKPRMSSGQANENELKDMLEKNLTRSLEEIASEVVANERTSSAEKTKQLFAMLWYVGVSCLVYLY